MVSGQDSCSCPLTSPNIITNIIIHNILIHITHIEIQRYRGRMTPLICKLCSDKVAGLEGGSKEETAEQIGGAICLARQVVKSAYIIYLSNLSLWTPYNAP
jgi:hypothetical protein